MLDQARAVCGMSGRCEEGQGQASMPGEGMAGVPADGPPAVLRRLDEPERDGRARRPRAGAVGGHQSMMAPQLRLMTAPVMAPAAADARYTAVPATSASRGRRPSSVSFTRDDTSSSETPG